MARFLAVFFVMLGCLAAFTASWPLLAQADIFVRQGGHDGKDAKSSAKPRIYVSPKNNKSRRTIFHVRRKIKKSDLSVYERSLGIDPELLTMKGPGPQTAEELTLVAAAHRAPKMAATLKLMQEKRRAGYEVQRMLERGLVSGSRTTTSQKKSTRTRTTQAVKKKTIFNSLKGTVNQEASRVFKNFR